MDTHTLLAASLLFTVISYIAAVTDPPMGKNIFKNNLDPPSGSDFDCNVETVWMKQCKVYDFHLKGCAPWDLSSCPQPTVINKFAPCELYKCKVYIYYIYTYIYGVGKEGGAEKMQNREGDGGECF